MDYKYASIDEDRRERRWLSTAALIGSSVIGVVLIAALTSMATFGVMASVRMNGRPQVSCGETVDEAPKKFSCGETFDEAHQRGCTFDPLTLTWLHPKCSQFGQQEFQEVAKNSTDGSWQYWGGEDGSHELGGYEALTYLAPGDSYWTTQEHHLYHCMWMLLRVHDAATDPGKRLDTKSSSYEHTKHCLEMLVKQASIGVGDKLSQVVIKGRAMDIGWSAC